MGRYILPSAVLGIVLHSRPRLKINLGCCLPTVNDRSRKMCAFLKLKIVFWLFSGERKLDAYIRTPSKSAFKRYRFECAKNASLHRK